MSEEDNRADVNLLLLCEPHAFEIDATPDHYPVDLLRRWQQAQRAEYFESGKSWVINNAQAAEIASKSFDTQALIEEIRAILPFTPRMRSRDAALDLVTRRIDARRRARLQAAGVLPERLDALLSLMRETQGPVPAVAKGQLRVLTGRMGAGKTEQALLWHEAGLNAAYLDGSIDIPVWLRAREARAGLESALIAAIGGEPGSECRVVVDNLDDLSMQEASQLMAEARELVLVWPNVSFLVTARASQGATELETISVEPWPADLGRRILELLTGEDVPWNLWSPEVFELLRNPLTTLAFAARLNAGDGVTVSKLQLLSDLARKTVQAQHPGLATAQTWEDLPLLAAAVLNSGMTVPARSFASDARVAHLTATGLVFQENGKLGFTLPLHEQHFGADAITSGLVELEIVASGSLFPRWRYAIATAIAVCEPAQADTFMLRLARTNPGAASWILEEVSTADAGPTSSPPQTPVRIGTWLRESTEAFLEGLRPLNTLLSQHTAGSLTQWGVWTDSSSAPNGIWVALAEAVSQPPTPPVIELNSYPELGDDPGWNLITEFRLPTGRSDRWRWARERVTQRLPDLLRRRVLPGSPSSMLTRERIWLLAQYICYGRFDSRLAEIPLELLRSKAFELMDTVENTTHATWQWPGYVAHSEDIQWLNNHLETLPSPQLSRPWPGQDQPNLMQKWQWEGYSPALTLALVTDIFREAIVGYRDLVETNFPTIASTLGLYGSLPIYIRGVVIRNLESPNGPIAGLQYAIVPDEHGTHQSAPVQFDLDTPGTEVNLPDITRVAGATRIHQRLELHLKAPASNFAYRWLADDLESVRLLRTRVTFHD